MSSAGAGEPPEAVAVVGMAGRFPGAGDLAAFWDNLRRGVESVTYFSREELVAAGVDPDLVARPDYVPARPTLEGIDLFDAELFAVHPREAELMDPQHRLFLECAWEALEDAGYDPGRFAGWIGVFAGAAPSGYLLANLVRPGGPPADPVRSLQLQTATDKDHLATRVSYKLDLRGPSVTVGSACSTGLVAVDLARQSLLSYSCDLALAGGVAVSVPQTSGYLYREGSILAPDGHCRAFAEGSQGTLFGSGVGLVVLKRLSEAVADGDSIRAVIRGSAVNNDGAARVGYTAPGVDGQTAVIAMAQGIAGVDPETVGYVEAHGTGTPLGDQIEIEALTRAFRAGTERSGFCALGSVKSNVGHLETAAGVAGLIKTILAVEHGVVPPSLHCRQPNPALALGSTPFFVPSEAIPWPLADGPRRAGVSSFGMGGTNAHVVLEQAPEPAAAGAGRAGQLLLLSARSPLALEAAAARLAAHLEAHPDLDLADVAYTLAVGRRPLEHRRWAVCRSLREAVEALTAEGGAAAGRPGEGGAPVAFLFPGQGEQYPGMAAELYRGEEAFRAEVDRCAELLAPHLGRDLRDLLFPPAGAEEEAGRELARTTLAQPALFVVERSLAALLMSWGVRPEAMIGHSVGELVAAELAGVFSLADALRLVALRGRLMEEAGPGAMLAVGLGEEAARRRLGAELDLAAVNGPGQSVVSGSVEAVAELARELGGEGVENHRLGVAHAFHSRRMKGAAAAFRAAVAELSPAAPRIPFLSGVTGGWIGAEEATSPDYWGDHLRRTVRFGDGLEALAEDQELVMVEVGPGRALSGLAAALPELAHRPVLAALAHPRSERSEGEELLRTLGRVWLAGATVDWAAFYGGQRRRRVPLPTYPFQRRRYWVEAPAAAAAGAAVSAEDGGQASAGAAEVGGPAATPGEGSPTRASGHRRPALDTPFVAPRSDTEATLAALWQEVLGIEGIGVSDNFFDLGGHSLVATQLVGRISESLGVDLELARFTEVPTVAAQAVLVEELRAEAERRERAEILDFVNRLTDEEAEAEVRRRRGEAVDADEAACESAGRRQEG